MKLFFDNHRATDSTHVVTRIQRMAITQFPSSLIKTSEFKNSNSPRIAMLHLGTIDRFYEWFEYSKLHSNVILVFLSSEPLVLTNTLKRLGIEISEQIRVLSRSPEVFLREDAEAFFRSVIEGTPDFEVLIRDDTKDTITDQEIRFTKELQYVFEKSTSNTLSIDKLSLIKVFLKICKCTFDPKSSIGFTDENSQCSIVDYCRDKDAFAKLWGVEKNIYKKYNIPHKIATETLLKLSNFRRIILVESDSEETVSGNRLGRHISAASWCQLFLYVLVQKGFTCPQIILVDARSEGTCKTDTGLEFLMKSSINARQHLSDCISYFRVNDNQGSINELLKRLDVHGPSPVICMSSKGRDALKEFAEKWWQGLAESDYREDHHSLNNSLGPIALSIDTNETTRAAVIASCEGTSLLDTPLARASLMAAMRWARSQEQALQATEYASSCRNNMRKVFEGLNRELRILLLDDQADEGWIPVFNYVFSLEPESSQSESKIDGFVKKGQGKFGPKNVPVTFWVETRVNNIQNLILNQPSQLALQSQPIGIKQRLVLTESHQLASHDFDEVLFLDLRLFSGQPFSNEREALKSIGLKLGSVSNSDHFGIESQESNSYLDALTWLPKLLSSFDFTYPITIWSSTQQRLVTERFKDIPSIFTLSSKPSFGHYTWTFADCRFEEAIHHALQLHKARALIFPQASKQVFPSVNLQKSHVLAEIFYDESDAPKTYDVEEHLWIGGILLIHFGDSEIEAYKQCKKFEEESSNHLFDLNGQLRRLSWILDSTKPGIKLSKNTGQGEGSIERASKICSEFASIVELQSGLTQMVVFALKTKKGKDSIFPFERLDTSYYHSGPQLLSILSRRYLKPLDVKSGKIAFIPGSRWKVVGRYTPRNDGTDISRFRSYQKLHNTFFGEWARGLSKNPRLALSSEYTRQEIGYMSVSDQWTHSTLYSVMSEVGLIDKWKAHAATTVDLEPSKNDMYRQYQYITDIIAHHSARNNLNELFDAKYVICGSSGPTLDESYRAFALAQSGHLVDAARTLGKLNAVQDNPLIIELLEFTSQIVSSNIDSYGFSKYATSI